MRSPGALKPNDAFPWASVVTLGKAPRKILPWPKPLGSAAGLAKNSSRNAVVGALLRVPETVVLPPATVTAVMTGKFWRLLGPTWGPPGVLGVARSLPRSIPRPVEPEFGLEALPKMELPRMAPPVA